VKELIYRASDQPDAQLMCTNKVTAGRGHHTCPGRAEVADSIKFANGTKRATTAKPEALEPRAYDKTEVGKKHHRKARRGADSRHRHKKASAMHCYGRASANGPK